MMMTMIGALIVHHFLIEIAQLLDLSREFWFISYVVASKVRQIQPCLIGKIGSVDFFVRRF